MVAGTIGWLGTFGTIGAYVLLAQSRLDANGLTYALLNAFGGLLASAASALYGAWPSAASNFVWSVVGFHGIVKVVSSRRAARASLDTEVVARPHETPVHAATCAPCLAA